MGTPTENYRTALGFVYARSAHERGLISDPRSSPTGLERGLRRTRALLDLLGAPDRRYPIVHIAGSKGKGSTAADLASIGRAAGYRTGLYTSPHLHSFRERIAIDGMPVDENCFAELASICRRAIEQLECETPELGQITAFELLTTMGLLAFAEHSCDLAVVEVGLGGTFDATNVVHPAVSVITHLDLEHTQILGETLAEIATNKAGIIEPGIPVVTIDQQPEAMRVVTTTAKRLDAPLLVYGRDFRTSGIWRSFVWEDDSRQIEFLHSGMAGPHQLENAALAIAAWQRLEPYGFVASDAVIREGIARATLPGRFERVVIDGRSWILDGAHTPVAAAALATEVLEETGMLVIAIAGLLNDKHPDPFFHALAPAISELIVTEPHSPRAIDVDALVPVARAAIPRVASTPNLSMALEMASSSNPTLITGSLVLVAEARELLGLAVADPSPVDCRYPRDPVACADQVD